jgi:hypothetical protein
MDRGLGRTEVQSVCRKRGDVGIGKVQCVVSRSACTRTRRMQDDQQRRAYGKEQVGRIEMEATRLSASKRLENRKPVLKR